MPGRVREDEQRAVRRRHLDREIVEIVRAAQQPEAAFMARPGGGRGIEIEENGDALGGRIAVDEPVAFGRGAAQREHGRCVVEVERELVRDRPAECGSLQLLHQECCRRAEAERSYGEGAAPLERRQVGDDAGERLGRHELRHDDVPVGVGGDPMAASRS